MRPGGVLLLADFRPRTRLGRCEAEFGGAGLAIEAREEISLGVLAALKRGAQVRWKLIQELAPRRLRPFFRNFAGVPRSRVFRGLADGELAYMCYRLRRPLLTLPAQ